MNFLLDVNALIAFGIKQHLFHQRVVQWARALPATSLLTCPITELGFIRISALATTYRFSIDQAQYELALLKSKYQIQLIPDDISTVHLPTWVASSKQTTDGYLLALAQNKSARLASFDARIPDAFLIP